MRTTDSLEKVIDDFIGVLYAQPHSKKVYYSHLNKFVYWCHENKINPREPTATNMREFYDWVMLKKHGEYKKALLQTVKRFWNWVARQKFYHNVCEDMPIPKSNDDFTRRALTEPQANNLIASIPKDTPVGKRDWLMVLILLITGIRVIELSRIRTQDFSQIGETNGFYYQQKGRYDKNQFKALDSKLYSTIKEYMIDNGIDGDDMALFCSYSNSNKNQPLTSKAICNVLSKRLTKANLKSKHISVHSLRHTSGTLASLTGSPQEEIQAHLGHASAKMTRRYINEAIRQRSLQNQIGNKISNILQY
jgi:site-specific recombinase XerD